MDEEVSLRNVMRLVLESWGCEAALAANGEEALAGYAKAMARGHCFDAVILDLTVVRGMGGQETLQGLLKINPAVKAIAMSGYPDLPAIRNPLQNGFKESLEKPFLVGRLKETLERVLESSEH